MGEHKAANGAACPDFSGELQSPNPTKQQQAPCPPPMLPWCWWQGSNLVQGVFGDRSPRDGAEAAPGLNPLRVEELNPAQMAGGLRQPQICHKQMVTFPWLYFFFFLSIRRIPRSFQDLG